MIKAEKCKDGIKVDFSCSPLVRALEFGHIVRKFYDITCEEVGEERAKKYMQKIFHSATMNEQEMKKELIGRLLEDPATMMLAIKLQRKMFGGDQDGE